MTDITTTLSAYDIELMHRLGKISTTFYIAAIVQYSDDERDDAKDRVHEFNLRCDEAADIELACKIETSSYVRDITQLGE